MNEDDCINILHPQKFTPICINKTDLWIYAPKDMYKNVSFNIIYDTIKATLITHQQPTKKINFCFI